MDKLKVFEAFAGYGSQSIALRNLGIPHEVVAISEIDKYAIKAYNAIHGSTLNLGDISKIKVEDIPKHDLFTYSFPCQDLSVAGKQTGLEKGTRSGLLYECKKVIEHCRPKYLLLENVKNLVCKKFKPQFDEWLDYLKSLGYTNYWKVLNAKDYGVPQNRERVFVVSILGEHEPYKFPKPIPLDKCIADILEDKVDEKYYVSKEVQDKFRSNKNIKDVVDSPVRLGGLFDTDKSKHQAGSVWDTSKISPTLDTMQGGWRQPCIIDNDKSYIEYKGKKIELPCICASRGRNPENPTSRIAGLPTEQRLEFNTKGTANTITTVQKDNYVVEPANLIIEEMKKKDNLDFVGGIGNKDWVGDNKKLSRNYPQGNRVYNSKGIACSQTSNGGGLGGATGLYLIDYRIRKLTPRECFRLMGMKDDDIDKIQEAGISNTQQYKMAGNSIVVNVLEAIFKELFL